MRAFINYINYKNGSQEIIEDVVDFLRHDDHVIFKRKMNVSEKLFVQVEIKKINSIKISMKD